MIDKLYNLIIVAHPDDETIYFTGPLLQNRTYPWKVICVTNGNADGNGLSRQKDFQQACTKLNVESFEHWDYPDVFEQRLDVNKLINDLSKFNCVHLVYTHGVIGEYGHPHHQDVSFAVHKAFCKKTKVFSICHNNYPDEIIKLTKDEFDLKTDILTKIYHNEMNRFLNLVPATTIESFCEVSLQEVEAIYTFLSQKGPLDVDLLDKYKWLVNHIKEALATSNKRLF